MAISPLLPITANQTAPLCSNMVPPLQHGPPLSIPIYEPPPVLDAAYQSTTIEAFFREIEEHDSRCHLAEYASRFSDIGYLDLSKIFGMNVEALKASGGMPEGITYMVRREMDKRRKK